jgi:glycosyltransferase involved in cell wall biosynthesis
MAHNLKTILKAADRLRDQSDIRFMFVGDGADKGSLLALKEKLSLDNVTFVPQQPREEVPRYYATSDLCLVPLRMASLFTKNIPSKIYEVMACGKPIVIGTHGESRRLVERAEAGVGVEPDDDRELAEVILELSQDNERSLRLGANGRRYAEQHCRRSEIADRYIAKILEFTESH